MKMIDVDIEWTDKGCAMSISGSSMTCPVCGVLVNGSHTCGNRAPKVPRKTKKAQAAHD